MGSSFDGFSRPRQVDVMDFFCSAVVVTRSVVHGVDVEYMLGGEVE